MTFDVAASLDPRRVPGEIAAGRWAPVTRGTWDHGGIVANVVLLLKLYARSNPGWFVATADPGTKLHRNPDTLRGPDVGVVRLDRKPRGKGVEGWLEGAPELAVEVTSDSQSTTELAQKALEYLSAGGKMVWVLEPESQRVMVFTPPDHVRVLGKEDILDASDALPGFRCQVAELFE
jgi:Uma2 family endonuclease